MKKIRVMMLTVFLVAASLLTGCGTQQEDASEGQESTAGEQDDASEGQESTAGEQDDASEEQEVASEENSQVASAEEMAAPVNVVEEGMVPVEGKSIKDGTYSINVDSSSSMFKIEQCELTVQDGQMTAVMTMSGTGYLKVFMGTGEEAVNASEDVYIPFVENEKGQHTYEVPVEALNQGISCAAFSKNREKWYDRVLVFRADTLPQDALAEGMVTTPESLSLADGSYTVEVQLNGASGNTKVESPAAMRVEGGQVYVTIIWGSANYDYMKVNEETYELISTEGNSTFEIPVSGFDWDLPIIANTTALGDPVEMEYTLYFDSASIKPTESAEE